MERGTGIWGFFVHHRRFTYIIFVAVILLGGFSVAILPKEANPEVNVPFAVVTTVFPGAAAEDVEELVTDVLEEQILDVEEIVEVNSTSRESISSIGVEFNPDADSQKVVADLKEKVDEVISTLPDEAEDPVVQKISFENEPVLSLAFSGPYPTPQLKQYAENLKDDLKKISGVKDVSISGVSEREIKVITDKATLDSYGLSIAQVTSAIARANADIPTGAIETAGLRYNIRLAGRIFTADDVRKIPITSIGNAPIFVDDVATVIDGFTETTSIGRLSIDGEQTNPAVQLTITKNEGADIIRTSDGIFAVIENSRGDTFPENIVIEPLFDAAEFVRESLGDLTQSGIQTIIIVAILLLLFLGWKEALLAGIAIPLSFFITLGVISGTGSTLNNLTLFALVLALGILIDSAVVVVEGMHKHVESGKDPEDAALETIREFQLPLISGTLTTVFAFVPMLLMSGIVGEFVKHIPITVTIVLLSSLFVALGLITTIGVSVLRPHKHNLPTIKESFLKDAVGKTNELFQKLAVWYRGTLVTLLNTQQLRKRLSRTLGFLFILSIALPALGVLGVNMFPAEDLDFFYINVDLPVGTPIEETSNMLVEIEEKLYDHPEIKSFSTTVGSITNFDAGSTGGSGSHLGSIFINLKKDRDRTSQEIAPELAEILVPNINTNVRVEQLNSGPPTGAPIEVVISGKELDVLENLAAQFEQELKEIPGTQNISTSVPDPNGEFVLAIDRGKAALYGVNTAELAGVLRNAVSGTKATTIRRSGDEIEVIVKYALTGTVDPDGKTTITDLSSIEALTIATREGEIPLSAFTRSSLEGSRPSIEHRDGIRIMRVTGQVLPGATATGIFTDLEERMDGILIPNGYTVRLGGETDDITQSYNDMFRAMFLAIFLIAGALVLQFRSYRQPLFILITIPLAMIGVFFGLFLVGSPVTFPGIIGVVALVGIVVNNAIILIDRINQNRRIEDSIRNAIITASTERLRPILLTTITTVVGILPITLSSELWGPLGFSIIFGLSFSTITTLFVIPMLYDRFARRDDLEG